MPTLTWSASNERAVSIAGTNSTVAELLVAIKAAIDNDSVYWQTSDYSAPNGTLEIKRKTSGSPTGEYASCRILFFGGQTPNAAAITLPPPSLNATSLYCAMSVDAATTGPSASYASAAPYSTKYIRGALVCGGTALAAASLPRVSLIESTDGLAICLHDTTNSATAICGYLLEDVTTSGFHWLVSTSCGSNSNIVADTTAFTMNAISHIIGINTSGAFHAQYWNSTTGTCRMCGRTSAIITTTSNPILGSNGAPCLLMPVVMGDAILASSATISLFGYLRQIRLGPHAQNLSTIRDSGGVTQGIHLGPPMNATGYGIWFDQAE